MPQTPGDGTKGAWVYSQMGLQLAASAGLGAWAGHWADGRWGWSPWGLVVGLLAGSGVGLAVFILDALKISRTEEEKEKKP